MGCDVGYGLLHRIPRKTSGSARPSEDNYHQKQQQLGSSSPQQHHIYSDVIFSSTEIDEPPSPPPPSSSSDVKEAQEGKGKEQEPEQRETKNSGSNELVKQVEEQDSVPEQQ